LLVAALVFAFRKQIRALLGEVKRATIAGVTVDFEEKAKEVRDELEKPATSEANPLEEAAFWAQSNAITYTAGSDAPASAPLRTRYAQRAIDNPLNAILEAYLVLEAWFDSTLTAHELSPYDGFVKKGVIEMATDAAAAKLISQQSVHTINGVTIMRELAIQKRNRVTTDEAQEYLVLMDGLIYSLGNEVTAHDKNQP
jgi:hypothetical protein